MGQVSNYLDSNELPCLVWLNGTRSASFDLTTSTFVWKNNYGSTDYDFIQSDTALHPAITESGVTFSTADRLTPRVSSLFSSVESYSLIFITYGNGYSSENTLLNIKKIDSTKPDWLRYKYDTNQANQQFSLVNLTNPLTFDALATDTQTLGITHDIKRGISRVKVDENSFDVVLQSDRGYPISNYPGAFYLGNSGSTPFSGNLAHFMVFIPAIEDVQIADLIQLLLAANYTWDDLTEEDWDSLEDADWDAIE